MSFVPSPGVSARSNSNVLVVELARLLNVREVNETALQSCIKLLDQGVDPVLLARHIVDINSETRGYH